MKLIFAGCLAAGLAAIHATEAAADGQKGHNHGIIDVHTHPVGKHQSLPHSLMSALKLMNRFGVRRMILSSPPKTDGKNTFDFKHLKAVVGGKKRFAFLGGGGSLNPMLQRHENLADAPADLALEFDRTAQAIVNAGAAGFGEMASLHISLFRGHKYEFQPADHPYLRSLADISARTGLPIDLHMDTVESEIEVPRNLQNNDNPAFFPETLAAFERLLKHNPKSKIVWAHAGSDPIGEMTAELIGGLMDRYENLYASLRIKRSSGRMQNLVFYDDGLDGDWLEVLKRHPDRFVIGTDTFFIPPKVPEDHPLRILGTHNEETLEATVAFLSLLPPDLARKIAHENAIRIYNLGPGKPIRPKTAPIGQKRGKFLSKADIRRVIIGNTLNFAAPSNGKILHVYFADDGSAIIGRAGKSKKIKKKWSINKKGMLCRTYGKKNKKQCTRVKPASAPGKFTLFNKKVNYEATLHQGAKFPN